MATAISENFSQILIFYGLQNIDKLKQFFIAIED